MVFVDTISRLVPGVVGDFDSVREDSLYSSMLKYPQYTRPDEFRGIEVPQVLISGDHGKIRKWRRADTIEDSWVI